MDLMIDYLLSQDEMLMPKTRMILVAKADELKETIEKQQIKNAWVDGGRMISIVKAKNAEHYYTNTFKQ